MDAIFRPDIHLPAIVLSQHKTADDSFRFSTPEALAGEVPSRAPIKYERTVGKGFL